MQEEYYEDLKNFAAADLSSRLNVYLDRFLYEKAWTHEELLQVLPMIDPETVSQLMRNFFSKLSKLV